ncbi:hypothetical protein SAMN02745883_01760 [Caminicella sporogenes DSM 14501]|uniref:Uncharacterized protein n=1 Tax=Caminicella sporogenes DSM 14501 TaxID=1121266 RepID=A0A1M6RE54_9FIRM|nr:hypothetical protein [Caminicella sporogenes]RKD25208.1 hypothetical protein BET04_03030 [Caminicella sporogenes]SHK30732.1 hypothetical protein SAMN02745883_01760 [Caminicella sporogenes DSM 14501]
MSLLSILKEINIENNKKKDLENQFDEKEKIEHPINQENMNIKCTYFMSIVLIFKKYDKKFILDKLDNFYEISDLLKSKLENLFMLSERNIEDILVKELRLEKIRYCMIMDVFLLSKNYNLEIDNILLKKISSLMNISVSEIGKMQIFIDLVFKKKKGKLCNYLENFNGIGIEYLTLYILYSEINVLKDRVLEIDYIKEYKKYYIRFYYDKNLKIITTKLLDEKKTPYIYWNTDYDIHGKKVKETVCSTLYRDFKENIFYKYKNKGVELSKSKCYGLYNEILNEVLDIITRFL